MSTKATVQSMIDTLTEALADAEKHDAGQNAAGTRLRKAAQEVRVKCADLRKTVSADRDARKG